MEAGSELGLGNFVVGASSGPITISGLKSATTYFFRVYEFNATIADTENYNINEASGNPNSVSTLPAPTISSFTPAIGGPGTTVMITGTNFTGVTSVSFGGTPAATFNVESATSIIADVGPGASGIVSVTTSGDEATLAGFTFIPIPVATAATAITQTTFTANWGVSTGAIGYYLDVSTSPGFTAFITGYDNLSVGNVTSYIVNTNLEAGTTYYYRVRSSDVVPASSASNTISLITIPSAPVIMNATEIGQNSFRINWSASSGADEYFIQVSEDDFITFLIDLDGMVGVTGTTFNVSGLSLATAYNYRIQSSNTSGKSPYSTTANQFTKTMDPVAIGATNFQQTSFVANWIAVPGADNYYLEVSLNVNLSSPLTGYDGTTPLDATNSSNIISGLSPGLLYYFRVTAENLGGRSTPSNTISQITIPSNPIVLDPLAEDITSSSIKAKWNAVIGAINYELEVSSDDFNTLLSGYNPKIIDLVATTQELISGLDPMTPYKFRVRANNNAGVSGNSNTVSVITLSDAVGSSLALSNISYSAQQESGSSQTLNFTVNGGTSPYDVVILYKGILAIEFDEETLTVSSEGNYSFDVSPAFLDDLGFEFEVQVTDASGQTDSQTGKIFVAFEETESPPVPFQRFGGTIESWNLFSIPYELDNNSISSIFVDLDPARHEFDWRIMRYRSNSNNYVNFNTGQNKIGEAYWFNSKENVTINVGGGQVTTEIPFTMNLVQGWNLIGNPYNITISWNQVLSDNGDPAEVGQLQVFSGTNQSTGNVMNPFTGGFVFAEVATSLTIDPRTAAGGRRLNKPVEKIKNHEIDKPEWIVHLNLDVNGNFERIGGVGMHPEALPLKDEFDQMAVPRFVAYSDLYTTHEEYFYPWFATDVVPTDQAHSWEFKLASNKTEGLSTITWDHKAMGENEAELILLDKQTGQAVDMKATGSYTVDLDNKEFEFEIFYSADEQTPLSPKEVILGDAYPNPANTSTFIPLAVPASDGDVSVRLTVLDINGKQIKTLVNQPLHPGFHHVEWDLTNDGLSAVGRGLYIYRVEIDGKVLQKKLIVE